MVITLFSVEKAITTNFKKTPRWRIEVGYAMIERSTAI